MRSDLYPNPRNNKSSYPAQAQGICETTDCEREKEVQVEKGLFYWMRYKSNLQYNVSFDSRDTDYKNWKEVYSTTVQ